MTLSSYLALLAVSAVLAVTPGQDTMLALRNALVSRRAGLGAATGSSVAALVWAALAATGLAALFQASPVAYELLSLIGGLYVIFLGVRAMRSARVLLKSRVRTAAGVPALVGGPYDPQAPEAAPRDAVAAQPRSRRSVTTFRGTFLIGLASCMTNPKVGLFFLALFPQFTPVGASPAFAIGVLGGTVAMSMLIFLVGVVLLVDAANTWLSNPVVTGRIEMGSGVILAGLGVYLSVTGVLGLLA
ncbi:LysE family translocator [Nesterenkonia sp. Act20]|uniref:LysE family translocator n=1 Tax=Nesterenkonia sp. Act20 TaxID=1483432 RepID=UPI001C4440A7|nr:LysE family translocator [Nesterenkonia sp. Act20]